MLSSINKPHTESITAPVQTIYGYRGPVQRIMLVDDESSHRQLMRAMLTPLGFDVIEMDNPLNVIARLAQEHTNETAPDLIMLDVSMPGINGWQLAQAIRDNHYTTPIIMVSADASEGKDLPSEHTDEEISLHNAYVIKPVRIPLLLDHIGRLLNISWRYENETRSDPETQSSNNTESHLIATDANNNIITLQDPDLDESVRLATIGHKKGLQEKIQQLQHDGNYSQPDAQLLQQLASYSANFQFEKMLELIDQYTAAAEPL